jgi:mRNA-degrading endonuclease RelE of RelBE toxin-antitoxin system
MNHFANPSFWECYRKLPRNIQKLADENFKLLKEDPKHPSLHLKKVGRYWSARVGIKYRTVAVEIEEGLVWFWIGTHAEYDKLIQ